MQNQLFLMVSFLIYMDTLMRQIKNSGTKMVIWLIRLFVGYCFIKKLVFSRNQFNFYICLFKLLNIFLAGVEIRDEVVYV